MVEYFSEGKGTGILVFFFIIGFDECFRIYMVEFIGMKEEVQKVDRKFFLRRYLGFKYGFNLRLDIVLGFG